MIPVILIMPLVYLLVFLGIAFAFLTGMLNGLMIAALFIFLGINLLKIGGNLFAVSEGKALGFIILLAGVAFSIYGVSVLIPGMLPFQVADAVGAPALQAPDMLSLMPIEATPWADLPIWVQVLVLGVFAWLGYVNREGIGKAFKNVKRRLT